MFASRAAAGRALAPLIHPDPDRALQVLALSREGVAVAAQVAATFGADLEMFCVRTCSVAVLLEGCRPRVDLNRVVELGLHPREVDAQLAQLRQELDTSVTLYRGHRALPNLYDRHVVVVDDGAARSLELVTRRMHDLGAGHVTVAVPACTLSTLSALADAADEVICIEEADRRGVSYSYGDTEPIGDLEALALLWRSRLAASRVRSAAHGLASTLQPPRV